MDKASQARSKKTDPMSIDYETLVQKQEPISKHIAHTHYEESVKSATPHLGFS